MNLKKGEQKFWEKYLAGLEPSERPNNPVVTAGYAGSSEICESAV